MYLFRLVGKTVSGGLCTYEPARIYKPLFSIAIFAKKKFGNNKTMFVFYSNIDGILHSYHNFNSNPFTKASPSI
jgi:hypothetical protein